MPAKSDVGTRRDAESSAVLANIPRSRAFWFMLAVAAYTMWARYAGRIVRETRKWGSGRVTMLMAAALVAGARRLGVTAYNEVEAKVEHLRPLVGRQVMACWHPHGMYVVTPFIFHSGLPRDKTSWIYGYFTAVAAAVFHVPFFREALMLVNARVADQTVIDSLLRSGKSVFLCPGGMYEQLATDPKQERAFFPPNLGFVRLALKHGVPLVPTYNFGENQLYDVPEWSRRFSAWLKDKFNVGIPLGIGRWGLPFVPKPNRINAIAGEHVEVGPPRSNPTEEEVWMIFRQYCINLQKLFHANCAAYLPEEVAARGLQMIWRGHESEDLSLDILLNQSLDSSVQGMNVPTAQTLQAAPANSRL